MNKWRENTQEMQEEEQFIKEAAIYERKSGAVICAVCERKCVISADKLGFCRARKNIDGRLYTLVYGKISALESRKIELKPFYHFMPGTTASTFATWSCNFQCPWCQNYSLSKYSPPQHCKLIPPIGVIKFAKKHGDAGVCASFNEPTLLLEYCVDTFKIAQHHRLYSTFVSNGYMSERALRLLVRAGLNAINIDVKGDEHVYQQYCGVAGSKVVWRNIRLAKQLGAHVEVVYLVITNVNDSEATAQEIIENHLRYAGPDTPLHINRYYPAYRFEAPPTAIKTLERIYKCAKNAGINYVYIGNVHGHWGAHTYCPNCSTPVIKRMYGVVKIKLVNNKCPNCGTTISVKASLKGNVFEKK